MLSYPAVHEVFVQLLDEGTMVYRPTQAVSLGGGRYRLLATENYDPEAEKWEFPPGTVVECRWVKRGEEELLIAEQGLPLRR